ncbi:hypothetical protein [Actinoplanes sp. NBRC 103695]|uniref:hypothetical protein n=1 Tax=Actinoplanes sp. NBRC 103695 TaxID=3032202 RepID=UPI002556BC1F|nr:hypothetical protein [Actinoplanes sp. NBRC 103695]
MLRKLVAAAALGLALVAGAAAPAHAAGNPPGSIDQISGSGYLYEYSNWGGIFFRTTLADSRWIMPNDYYEVFVIGTDHKVWTKWSGSFGLSAWTDQLGGRCNGARRLTYKASGWNVTLRCTGMDGLYWINKRNTAGAWTGWRPE